MEYNLRILLYSLAVFLFVGNYQICEFFYPDLDEESVKAWWIMKSNIYSVIVVLLLLSSSISEKGVLRFVLSIGVGLSLSDVVDRLYFNTNQFNEHDLVMIAITIIGASISYKKEKDAKHNDK